MRVQIASDLHIEYNSKNLDYSQLIYPNGEILILAGDIGSFYNLSQLKNFLNYCCENFTYVIYVIGNCEYYLSNEDLFYFKNMDTLKEEFKTVVSNLTNLYILDRSSIQIGNYLFTGCTLWSDLKKGLPLNYKIRDMSSMKYSQLFQRDLEYIKKKSNYCKEKKLKHIVVTHYAPLIMDVNKNKGDLYMSDLRGVLDKYKIDYWIYGHIHNNLQTKYNDTEIICNQKGKPGSFCQDYNKKFVIQF